MLDGGAIDLADARIANVKRMRRAGIGCPMLMLRPPMLSQVSLIDECCEISFNTEFGVIAELAAAAQRKNAVHGITLMVEMGDMRDGVLPDDLVDLASRVAMTPGVILTGIGANFACLGHIAPSAGAMAQLSSLAMQIESECGVMLETVSGGGSANLPWALGLEKPGRINNLRLGEAILLGVEPVFGNPIDGLYTDAFTLIAEVIESNIKRDTAQQVEPSIPLPVRSILAIGLQDTDLTGIEFPPDFTFIGATSDHTVVESIGCRLQAGSEMDLQVNYSSLMRAMNARDIGQIIRA